MKKLNKKGFTLIELLAVIVILAIIVVVTVPTILNSIDDARSSSLNSLAKEVANWYDTSYAQDQIAIGTNKILGDVNLGNGPDTSWVCLSDINGSVVASADLAAIYGLSSADLNLGTALAETTTDGSIKNALLTTAKCSAIRLKKGRAEVLLVGNAKGKFGARYSYSSSDTSELITN